MQRPTGLRSPWCPRALIAVLVCAAQAASVAGQQPAGAARFPAIPEVSKATATGDAAAAIAFEEQIEDAIVKGDTAFVDRALAPDFVFVHGDRWTTGGKPQLVDDRVSFLKRVADRVYLVRDLDQVKVEMHPDVAITYGRYVNFLKSRDGNPAQLMSIWFQRVYAKRSGQWQWLSHRTVHGPTAAPAGVDPSVSDNSPVYGVGPVWYLKDPIPPVPPRTADERELLHIDQKVGTAVVSGNVDFVRNLTTGDFSMVHGDIWTRGGRANIRDNQESMLSRVVSKAYGVIDFDHIQLEMHGDVAMTYGRYLARSNGAKPEREWFSVWFERVYAKRDGRWLYLSHRTVHGPTYGPSREAVSDK